MIRFKKEIDDINNLYLATFQMIKQNLMRRCNEIADIDEVIDVLDTFRYCVKGKQITTTHQIACRTKCHMTISNVAYEMFVPSDYNGSEIRAWVKTTIDGQEMSIMVSISDSGIRFVRGDRYYEQVNRCWTLPTEFSDKDYASCVAVTFDSECNFLIHNLFDETTKKSIRPLTPTEFNEILISLENTIVEFSTKVLNTLKDALENSKNSENK